MATKRICPYCLAELNEKAIEKRDSRLYCVKCNEELPADMLETPNLIFSIVGVKGAGKTNYITAMLEEMINNSDKLHLVSSPQNHETKTVHHNNARLLYDSHQKLQATEPGELRPQIWRVKNLNRSSKYKVETNTFTIFDGSGKDHHDLGIDSVNCKYITASDAIMLIFDPIILKSVRDRVSKDIFKKSVADINDTEYKNSAEVVNNVAAYIKAIFGLPANQKVKIPVAVIFTKMDALAEDFTDCMILQKSPHSEKGVFQHIDSGAVETDIKAWLASHNENSFIDAIEADFARHAYFGVSSYGIDLENKSELDAVRPHRILDPILWLFTQKGFIDTSEERFDPSPKKLKQKIFNLLRKNK
ncbi:MAG: hypothetical protein LBM77_00945 [Spirochaetaceae bacterium]|jgi:hypothetical protein|nr:hypothetical protein [Spirochaetaceae bacterium]